MVCVGHVLASSVALKVGEKVLRSAVNLVAWVVIAWARDASLVPQVILESLLARAPSSSPRVFNGGESIHSVFIDFNTLAVSARSRCVLLDIEVERLYLIFGQFC